MKRDRNKTFAQQAQEFCASGEHSPSLTEAYMAGVKSGYEDMTDMFEWRTPAEELPKDEKEVLCMVDRYFQTYGVMKYLNNQWWQPLAPQPKVSLGGWIAAEKEPLAWRPIHEMEN